MILASKLGRNGQSKLRLVRQHREWSEDADTLPHYAGSRASTQHPGIRDLLGPGRAEDECLHRAAHSILGGVLIRNPYDEAS